MISEEEEEEQISESQPLLKLRYVSPSEEGFESGFACIANEEEHSKHLNSYSMYKYHLANCRELKTLSEVYICKFCVKLFQNIEKRDNHQSMCPCRMVVGNDEFIMPLTLKSKYTLNQVVFYSQEELDEILTGFPANEPLCSIETSQILNESQSLGKESPEGCCKKQNIEIFSDDERDNDNNKEQEEDLQNFLEARQTYLRHYKQDYSLNSMLVLAEINRDDQIQSQQEQEPSQTEVKLKKVQLFNNKKRSKYTTFTEGKEDSDDEEFIEQEQQTSSQMEIQKKAIEDNEFQLMHQQLGYLNVKDASSSANQETQYQPALKSQAKRGIGKPAIDIEEFLQGQEEENKVTVKDSEIEEEISSNRTSETPTFTEQEIQSLNKQIEQENNHQSTQQSKTEQKIEKKQDKEQQNDEVEPLKGTKMGKLLEVRVVELMRTVTLFLKERDNQNLKNPLLSEVNRKPFRKIDSNLLLSQSPLDQSYHLLTALMISSEHEFNYFKHFLAPIKSPNYLAFISHNAPNLADFFTSRPPYDCILNQFQDEKSLDFYILKVIQEETNSSKEQSDQSQDSNKQEMSEGQLIVQIYKYQGVTVWDKNQSQKIVVLTQQLQDDFLKYLVEQFQPFSNAAPMEYYNREHEGLSREREQSMQHLIDKRERLLEGKIQEEENVKKRIESIESQEKQIAIKKSEFQRWNQTQIQSSLEIKQLLDQIQRLKAGLVNEIEKNFQAGKSKSDTIYEDQISKHQDQFLKLTQENLSEKILELEQLNKDHKQLIILQMVAFEEQQKIGAIIVAQNKKLDELKVTKLAKEKLILMHKSNQKTAYPCLVCKKYPQNCHQKPCGHVVCCFFCITKENDEKGTIFCKLCKTEIIKFSEIKFKIV